MRALSVTIAGLSLSCMTAAAFAADMPVKAGRSAAVVAPAPVVYSWTGCFVGGNIGYGWAPTAWTFQAGGANIDFGSHDAAGVAIGGQIGCDYQTGNFVIGIEGLLDWASMDGSHIDPIVGLFELETEIGWLATVTGRIGWAIDRTLIYVRGGAAWADYDFTLRTPGPAPTGGDTYSGWTAGVGVEWLFSPGWSARLEYNYMDLDHNRPRLCAGGGCAALFDVEREIHLVSAGLNFRWR